jgi:hypothetical protein
MYPSVTRQTRWQTGPVDGLCQQPCSHQPTACVGHSAVLATILTVWLHEDKDNRKYSYLDDKWWTRPQEGRIPSQEKLNKMDKLEKHYEGHDRWLRGGDGGEQHVQAPVVNRHGGDGQAFISSRTETDQSQKDLRGPLKCFDDSMFYPSLRGGWTCHVYVIAMRC